MDQIALDKSDADIHAAENVQRALCDRVKNGLRVGWRAGNDLQDLGRGNLLLQRLLRLVEQAHVLDRD